MICDKCNKDKRTSKSFGKDICIECLAKRKTGIRGNSGMIYNINIHPSNYCNLSNGINNSSWFATCFFTWGLNLPKDLNFVDVRGKL